jgi:hypothetical protein
VGNADNIICAMANSAGKRTGRKSPTLDPGRILNEWTLLSRAHIPIHGGCSCGGGAGHIHIGDFEHDILDYLQKKYAGTRNDEAIALFGGAQGRVETLLERISEHASSPIAQSVLADIAKLVESITRVYPPALR